LHGITQHCQRTDRRQWNDGAHPLLKNDYVHLYVDKDRHGVFYFESGVTMRELKRFAHAWAQFITDYTQMEIRRTQPLQPPEG
jgi:hypothetical protein